ncbi:hypothetical protein CR513_05939, partial [Mucuna pruriens]
MQQGKVKVTSSTCTRPPSKTWGVVLPFDCFAANVLQILEVAPSQLHPNGWAAISL